MSSQGLTFPSGVVADLRRNGGMTDDIWWLNVYVMLSRATKLDLLLLLGLDEKVKTLLTQGPPKYRLFPAKGPLYSGQGIRGS